MQVQSPTVAVKTLLISGSADQGTTFVYNGDVYLIPSTYETPGITPPAATTLILRLSNGHLSFINENTQVVPLAYKAVPV